MKITRRMKFAFDKKGGLILTPRGDVIRIVGDKIVKIARWK